jgi:LPXTG-site transpeptidase (sortase) family protein
VATTRSLLVVAAVVGAAGLFVAACTTPTAGDQGVPQIPVMSPAYMSAGGTPTKPAQPTSSSISVMPSPAMSGMFSLVVRTRSDNITASVASISVASNEPVDPPHQTAAQWNTAVWVEQSSYPSLRSKGTSYVYGHACHHHLCPFTKLKGARVGDQVNVMTSSDTLTYRIKQIGISPRSASSLPSWASDSTEPNRIVLVTCAYEYEDISTNNIVVVAYLDGT